MNSPDPIDEVPTTLREDELRELGFEEDDEPTQMLLDPRPLANKPTTIVPPRIDEGDVYMLTEQHLRYKAGIVPMDDERVDLRDIMRAAPSLPPMSERVSEPVPVPVPAPAPVPRANSLSPVAMSSSDTTMPPAVVAARPRPHPAWPATLAVLSVAAIGVFFIRPSTSASASSAAALDQAPVVMNQAVELPATAAGAFELPAVEIEAPASPAPLAQPVNGQVAIAAQPPVAAPVPAEVPAANAAAEPAVEELPPPALPEPVAPPFDRSAAAGALSVAAGSASSCREPGVPSSPVSVRVTFAPSGSVTIALVESAPYAGTAAGGCIARTFRSARVPAFSGTPVTVHKTFQIN